MELSRESIRLGVENSPDSHKPVEIGDLGAQGALRFGGARGPNRPAEAADGPLKGRERGA